MNIWGLTYIYREFLNEGTDEIEKKMFVYHKSALSQKRRTIPDSVSVSK